MSVDKKPNTKGSYVVKIMKQTFDRSLMAFGWRVHKLGEFIHGKGNIRPSHPEMLEATNHLTVHCGIDRCDTIFSSQRIPTTNGAEIGLEPSMLRLHKRSITYFC